MSLHEEGFDPHLRAALRHAPDASVAPPEALSQRILAAARQNTHVQTSPPWPSRLAEWLSALARPPFAGAMAGVMVAVLGGVIWWGQPVDIDQTPAEEVAVAPAPAPAPVLQPSPQPVPTPTPQPSAEPPRSPTPAPAMKAPKPSRPPEAEAPRPTPEVQRDTAVATAPAEALRPTAPYTVTTDASRESRKAEAAPMRPELPAMAAAPAAPAAPATAAAPLAAPPPARAAGMQTAGASARARLAAPEPTTARFAPLLQQLAAEPGRWQGRVRAPADNAARVLDATALSALLRGLQAVVGDGWRPTAERLAEPALAELQLLQGGSPAQQVRLHADRIEWWAEGRTVGVIRLSPEGVAAALRAFE